MSDHDQHDDAPDRARRRFLQRVGTVAAAAAAAPASEGAWGGKTLEDALGEFFQDNYRRMTPEEVKEAIGRIERRAKRLYGVDITVGNEPPLPGVVFGYAINVSKCRGYRDCVRACGEENNQSLDMQYIRVLQLDQGSLNFEQAEHYYPGEQVPVEGKHYVPVQCQQCDNPPCVKACPVGATWKEPDGVVVVDYDWCIGCRYCMAACPYQARVFNWGAPDLPAERINPKTHYLGNRPRQAGSVEKCHFCLQRTRVGRLPACQEACPTGARVFGNLLDPESEIRYVLEHKVVFRLKEDVGTEPKFWYYRDV